MKHYLIFTIISLLSITISAMDTIQIHENRSLRDELIFIHTIKNQYNIASDITNCILYRSYLLRDINKLHFKFGEFSNKLPEKELDFNLLGETAWLDFLYLSNKEEISFLKMEPLIIIREGTQCINIIYTAQNSALYKALPEKIKAHNWWFVKEYEG